MDMSSKEASAILDSVHKKTKVFGCNLENYLKVRFYLNYPTSASWVGGRGGWGLDSLSSISIILLWVFLRRSKSLESC